jgi:hypothetical protein
MSIMKKFEEVMRLELATVKPKVAIWSLNTFEDGRFYFFFHNENLDFCLSGAAGATIREAFDNMVDEWETHFMPTRTTPEAPAIDDAVEF